MWCVRADNGRYLYCRYLPWVVAVGFEEGFRGFAVLLANGSRGASGAK